MNNEAYNKVLQTQGLFKKIITPLKNSFGLCFGYMIVFKNSHYYTIIDNLACLENFVNNVTSGEIFCERNVTNYFDKEYNFTLWPNEPTNIAMNIYNSYEMWNGITVSECNKDYTELYWFTDSTNKKDWHKFYIRNKQLLVEFIDYFKSYKLSLGINKICNAEELFKFKNGFKFHIPKSNYLTTESPCINKFINSIQLIQKELTADMKFSPREVEVLSMVCKGYTTKMIALKLDLSDKTVQHYIEYIKRKADLHYKSELVETYGKFF